MHTRPVIYFAGKIGKEDWRHALVPGLRGAAIDQEQIFAPSLSIDCGRFVYGGPFFVACDHGCYHGDNKHGARGGCGDDVDNAQRRIFEINRQRLIRAQAVFAYLESADAYGSFLEIGFAHAWNKPIGLRLPIYPRYDLWMIAEAATTIYRGTAAECFERFLDDLGGRGRESAHIRLTVEEWK